MTDSKKMIKANLNEDLSLKVPKKKKAKRRLKSLGAMVKREEYLANQNHGSLLREAYLVDSVGVNVGSS